MNASLTSPCEEAPSPKCAITARVALRVAGADDAVALHAHGVAGGVQRLGADHDRVEPEVVVVGVPGAVVDPAEQAEQVQRVDPAAVGDAVLAVGREDVVLRTQGAAGADLRGLLAQQLRPDAELAVALERGGLGVDAAGQHHVAVEAAQVLGGEVVVELRVVDALALGGQELDEVGTAVLLRGPEDLHQVGAETELLGRWLVGQGALLRGHRRRGVSAGRCGPGPVRTSGGSATGSEPCRMGATTGCQQAPEGL